MDTKYLSIAAALLLSCSPALPTTPTKPAPDCRLVDLTKKVGFSTSFFFGGQKFCYGVVSEDYVHYSEDIARCDAQDKLIQDVLISREFAGPAKGYMKLSVILAVSGVSDNAFDYFIDYLVFYRDPCGKITPASLSPAYDDLEKYGDLEKLFYKREKVLDEVKNVPKVCTELLEYQVR